MLVRHHVSRLLCGLLLAFGAAAVAGTTPRADEAADVPRVLNQGDPAEGTQRLTLQELWRVGGEDDEENIFGLITQVRADAAGNIYLLDTQLAHVEVYSPTGEHLRTLSREGEGPGEVRLPIDLALLPQGRVALLQSFPGKLVVLEGDDTPVGTITPRFADEQRGGLISLTDVLAGGDRLVLGGIRLTLGDNAQVRTSFIAAGDTSGVLTTVFLEQENTLDFSHLVIDEEALYFPLYRHLAVGPDGRVYLPPERNRYRIDVYNPDGTLERIIERDVAPWRRDEEQRRRIEEQLDAQLRNVPPQMQVTSRLSDYEPMINSLQFDDQGLLWVLAAPGINDHPDDVMAIYDVFEPDGRFLRRVAVPAIGDSDRDGLTFAGHGRLVLVKGLVDAARSFQTGGAAAGNDDEEAAPMEVVCYGYEVR